jgi:hypothetical protein
MKRPRSTHDKKLFSIIKSLDAELQLLGARGDWGWSNSAEFAAESLRACLYYISQLPDAPKGLLITTCRKVLDTAIRHEKRRGFVMVNAAEAEIATKKNAALFAELLDQYRKNFNLPEEG